MNLQKQSLRQGQFALKTEQSPQVVQVGKAGTWQGRSSHRASLGAGAGTGPMQDPGDPNSASGSAAVMLQGRQATANGSAETREEELLLESSMEDTPLRTPKRKASGHPSAQLGRKAISWHATGKGGAVLTVTSPQG